MSIDKPLNIEIEKESESSNYKNVLIEIVLPKSIENDRIKTLFYLIDERGLRPSDRVFLDGEWVRIVSES